MLRLLAVLCRLTRDWSDTAPLAPVIGYLASSHLTLPFTSNISVGSLVKLIPHLPSPCSDNTARWTASAAANIAVCAQSHQAIVLTYGDDGLVSSCGSVVGL